MKSIHQIKSKQKQKHLKPHNSTLEKKKKKNPPSWLPRT